MGKTKFTFIDLFSGIETNVEQYKRSIQAAKFATHLKEDFRQ